MFYYKYLNKSSEKQIFKIMSIKVYSKWPTKHFFTETQFYTTINSCFMTILRGSDATRYARFVLFLFHKCFLTDPFFFFVYLFPHSSYSFQLVFKTFKNISSTIVFILILGKLKCSNSFNLIKMLINKKIMVMTWV